MRASGQNVWWWVRRSREVQRASRSAYTLMEMLLVLAVLVIVAAITIPVIRSMMTDTRIDAAGDQVQSLAADTRARAMEDGRAWKLAYIPNSGFIQLAPEESDEWVAATTEVLEKKDLRREQLPLEIIFAATHDGIMGVQQAGQPGSTWETIAVYLANGSARDDGMVYFGKPGVAPMRINIRGLTGIAQVEFYNPNLMGR